MPVLFLPKIFDWDDRKAASNEAKHGVDFEEASSVYLDEARIDTLDQRRDYGEPRFNVIGYVGGVIHHVTYARRGDVARLISARKAHWKERKRYGDRS